MAYTRLNTTPGFTPMHWRVVDLQTAHDQDPGPDVLLLWAVASLAALLTLTQGLSSSVQ